MPLLLVASLVVQGLVFVGPSRAQQPLTQKSGSSGIFKLFGTFMLEVDGVADTEARLYHNDATGGVLVRSSKIEAPFQLLPRTREVQVFRKDDVIDREGGTVELFDPSSPQTSRRFDLEGSDPKVEIEGKVALVKAKPPLLGPHDASSIIAYNDAYRLKSEVYVPQANFMEQLQAVTTPVHVKIFFGTWCSTCSELMPHILKVERDLENPKVTFEYYGVPKDLNDPEARRNQVRTFPTGLIYRNGEEIGRVEGFGWRFPAMAIYNTLNGVSANAPSPNQR